jgi:uncharacterized membrane protein YkvA (DUF1232 family)
MRWVLIGLGVVVGAWLILVVVLARTGRRALARELVAFIPNVIRLFRDVLRDDRVPLGSKALVLFGAAWLASPIDLVPEFVPVVGPLDDVVVAVFVLRHLVKRAGPSVVREHWRGDPRSVDLLLRAARAR